jgi:hypothetical protein
MKWLKSKKKEIIPSDCTRYPYGDPTRQRSTDDPRPLTDTAPTSETQVVPHETTRSDDRHEDDSEYSLIHQKYLGKPNTDYTAERGQSTSKEEI